MAERGKKEKLRSYSTYFPLVSVDSVVELFRSQVTGGSTPDLTFLSIVLGAVENLLTAGDRAPTQPPDPSAALSPFPKPIEFSEIEELYQRFSNLVKGTVDLGPCRGPNKRSLRSSADVVKNVSNVIWAGLSSSYYKDRAHIQSLYSFLTGSKLDSFGVSLSVVAACQLLGLDDVHLALTEEHSWIVFGENGSQSIEVTWHGKGVEDKRGQPVTQNVVIGSWLYLSGHPVVCDARMEVAAMVNSINPSIAAAFDSVELNTIQQRLLWILYDIGSLPRFPMALTSIGDIEELSPTPSRPTPELLFKEAIDSTKTYYHNMHVYPYTYLGGYFYRLRKFKEAFAAWAEASQVISQYNYHRDDEEVYKEFLEIANEIIPNAIRLSTEFLPHSRGQSLQYGDCKASDMKHSSPLLQDPECCALFFKFYDGICEWEEGSSTPVLHITWATHMLNSLSKFDPDTRAKVRLLDYADLAMSPPMPAGTGNMESDADVTDDKKSDKNGNCDKDHHDFVGKRVLRRPGRPSKKASPLKISAEEDVKPNGKSYNDEKYEGKITGSWALQRSKSCVDEKEEDQIKFTIKELESRVGNLTHGIDPDPAIVALGHACGESILNPAYLLGKGEPFAVKTEANEISESGVGSVNLKYEDESPTKADAADTRKFDRTSYVLGRDFRGAFSTGNGTGRTEGAALYLKSAKMKEMKDLLTAKKLNANAIKLHLTAQSQVIIKHSRASSNSGAGNSFKRLRRS